MRWSQAFIPTIKEAPVDAESSSHKLMLRAGLIRRLSSGLYTYLPLCLRVIRKVEDIIRDEMTRCEAEELLMPILQPEELWEKSGRLNSKELAMLTAEDRTGRQFVLGPTHEEVITDVVGREIRSYRDLPKNFYQIQTKFRDELRPRFGLMRAKEFVMKDGYSFDVDEQSAKKTYMMMEGAYRNIFSRCGLNTQVVEADSGAMGGGMSHEFIALADMGEERIIWCRKCGYSANLETSLRRKVKVSSAEKVLDLEIIDTPGMKTIQDLTGFLGVEPSRMVKTLIYESGSEVIAVLVDGDRGVNETKLRKLTGAGELKMADEETIRKVTGSPLGFSGPVGLKGLKIIADEGVTAIANSVTGANEKDKHMKNVNIGRDYSPDIVADITFVREGDLCPECGEALEERNGIEVGQVFNLGTKYSESIGANFLDKSGQEKLCIMGCYGIGVTRTVSAIIEQNHDENGIIWPLGVSPYQVLLLPVNINDSVSRNLAERLYNQFQEKGIEVLFDDRDVRGGVKFNDADLVGIPVRITIGPEKASSGMLEIRERKTGKEVTVRADEVMSNLNKMMRGISPVGGIS